MIEIEYLRASEFFLMSLKGMSATANDEDSKWKTPSFNFANTGLNITALNIPPIHLIYTTFYNLLSLVAYGVISI